MLCGLRLRLFERRLSGSCVGGILFRSFVVLIFFGGWLRRRQNEWLCSARMLKCGAANGDVPDGVIANMVLVVAVNEIERGPAEGGERCDQRSAITGGVDCMEGCADGGWIVERPGERECAVLGWKEWRDDWAGDHRCADGVRDGEDIERNVAAAADDDVLGVVLDGRPCAVGLLELLVVAGAAEMFDADVLHVATEIREAPGEMRVATDDEPRKAGKCEAGDIDGCNPR